MYVAGYKYIKEVFGTRYFSAKIYWILYPQIWNSTTGVAIPSKLAFINTVLVIKVLFLWPDVDFGTQSSCKSSRKNSFSSFMEFFLWWVKIDFFQTLYEQICVYQAKNVGPVFWPPSHGSIINLFTYLEFLCRRS